MTRESLVILVRKEAEEIKVNRVPQVLQVLRVLLVSPVHLVLMANQVLEDNRDCLVKKEMKVREVSLALLAHLVFRDCLV